MAKGSKLNPRQARFVAEYLKDLNATQAAIRAGYSEKTANKCGPRLLVNAGIALAIEEGKKKQIDSALEEAGLSKLWVLERLKENVERCMQRIDPEFDEEGNPKGAYKWDPHGANRALELIGKEVGMFVEKKVIEGSADNPLKVSGTITVITARDDEEE